MCRSAGITCNMSDEKNEDIAVPKLGVRSSLIKNKLRRQLFYQKERLRKAKEKRERKESRKRQAEEQTEIGEDVSSFVDEKTNCTSPDHLDHDSVYRLGWPDCFFSVTALID